MARLPKEGQQNWGGTLNDYLLMSHNDDGTLKVDATQKALKPELDTIDTRLSAMEGLASAADVIYDPSKDGLTPLEQKTMTADGSQTLALSINGGRLRGSRTAATNGNMRSFVLVNDTEWENSEVEVVLWGPSFIGMGGGGNSPQMGTVHRYGTANGKQYGFVFWWNIFIFGPDLWNSAMWGANLDGTGFSNAAGAPQLSTGAWQTRTARGLRAKRLNGFGSWMQDHYVTAADATKFRWMAPGDAVIVSEFTDKTRTVAGVGRTVDTPDIAFGTNALLPQDVGKRITGTGIPAGTTIASITSATAGTLSANATETSSSDVGLSEAVADPTVLNGTTHTLNGAPDLGGGKLQLVAANQTAGAQDVNAAHLITAGPLHRRFFPIRVSSRLVGNRLQGRVARLEDPLPQWDDPTRVATIDMTAPTNLPNGFVTAGITSIPSGAGRCGLVFAHATTPYHMEAGLFKARQL
jgi:hypothetical protein